MTGRTRTTTRRRFLKGAASAALGAAAVPHVLTSDALGSPGRDPAAERITMGFIGVGSHGVGMNLRSFLPQKDAQAVVVCDVDANRTRSARDMVNARYADRTRSGTYDGCDATGDWRDVVARRDLDAVMISTPDHWHVPMSVAALKAGKDVICEKPTLTVAEGRVLADTVQRYAAVFQLSTEDRSVAVYHRMAELVRNGRIGKLRRIRVKLPAGPGSPGDPTPRPVPKELDYDLWLGPAPWAPYCPGRVQYHFRWVRDYSGGQLTDWGAHLIDTAQWANDTERSGPVEVEGTGRRHASGLYDTYHEYHLRYRYADGVEMLVDSGGVAIKFEGTDGWVGNNGWRGRLEASSPDLLTTRIGADEIRLFTCPAGEHRNFLDCVKSRRDPYFPAEIGHRCCSVMHIGNIAMDLGRKLRWDPAAERFDNDDTANLMLSRAMREPWGL
jgi:predicted dehydrogenase